MKKILALDFDETLIKLQPAWEKYHLEKFGTLPEHGWHTCEGVRRAHQFVRSEHHRNIEAVEGAVQAVRILTTRRKLVVVTARDQYLFYATLELLERHYPKTFRDIHFITRGRKNVLGSKGEVCIKIGASELLDDTVECVISARDAGVESFLFDRPHNQGVQVPGVTRVHSWEEFVTCID